MRIVALVHIYVPHHMAGSETMLHTMLRELVKHDHEVHVVTTKQTAGADVYDHQGVIVHRADGEQVREIVDGIGPELLISHHAEVPRATREGRYRGIPVVQVVHNTLREHIEYAALQNPALIVFNTHWVQRFYRRHTDRPSIVVHPPVIGSEHRTDPGEKVTLVNLSQNKGAAIFYALAASLPDLQFLGVIGAYDEQVIERSLPNVEIMPHTSDPKAVWEKTRIALMPSVYESYGMVGIEAAHSGIPTIASPTPGLRESLGSAGIFVERDDFNGWRDAILHLTDPIAWAAASAAAEARALELDPVPELARWVRAIEELA